MSSALGAEDRLAAASAPTPPDLIEAIGQAMLNATFASTEWTRFLHAAAHRDFLHNWQALVLHQQPSPEMSVALMHLRTAQSGWPSGGAARGFAGLADRDVVVRVVGAVPEGLLAMAIQPWFSWDRDIATSRMKSGAGEPSATVVGSRDRAARLLALADWSTTVADLDWDHLDSIDQVAWGQITDE